MILRFSKEGNVVLWGSTSLLGIRHNFHSRKTFLLRPPIIYKVSLQIPELLLLFLPRVFQQLMSPVVTCWPVIGALDVHFDLPPNNWIVFKFLDDVFLFVL